MDRALNASLDDIIKRKRSGGRGRFRGVAPQGRGGFGASFGSARVGRIGTLRQGPLGVNSRPSAVTIAKSFRRTKNFPLQRDLLEESLVAAGYPRRESCTSLFISNLDFGVSNDDIRELFSEIGELKRYAIHLDRNGRPSGSAEVVYARRSDAFAALKRYNNVQLDGRPMKIEMPNPNSEVPVAPRVNVIGGMDGRITRKVVLNQPVVGTRSFGPVIRGTGMQRGLRNGWGPQGRGTRQGNAGPRSHGQVEGQRQGWGRGRGRGRGLQKKNRTEKSASELDKELDEYHAEAMQT